MGKSVDAILPGFVDKDFEAEKIYDDWRCIYYGNPFKKPESASWSHTAMLLNKQKLEMHNAREL